MRYEKLARIAGLVCAAMLATIAFVVTAHAVVTAVTPNSAGLSYNLASGSNSVLITTPANLPVFVMGDQIQTGNVGSSEMTLVNSSGHLNQLVWSGLESHGGVITSGNSSTTGAHMIYIDANHCVDIQVNNGTSFRIHNACSTTMSGNATEVW